jgi:hypothetical protein
MLPLLLRVKSCDSSGEPSLTREGTAPTPPLCMLEQRSKQIGQLSERNVSQRAATRVRLLVPLHSSLLVTSRRPFALCSLPTDLRAHRRVAHVRIQSADLESAS